MRVSSLLRTIVCIAAVPVAGLSANAVTITVDNIVYEVDDYDYATIVGYSPELSETVTIPYVVTYKSGDDEHMFYVSAIADRAFVGSGISELIFGSRPYSIPDKYDDLTIGKDAFDVPSLKTIIVHRQNVPLVDEGVEVFDPDVYENAELVLGDDLTRPQVEAYDSTYPWDRFRRRVATGIVGPQMCGGMRIVASNGVLVIDGGGPVAVYNIGGGQLYRGDGNVTLTGSRGVYVVSTPFGQMKVAM